MISWWLRDRRFSKAQISPAQGFTLIELLVVIIIIGLLAAIALPTFLNQSNKARYGEAKTYTGTMSRLQQAYYLEKQTFAGNINLLGLGVNTTTNSFTYSVVTGDINGNASPSQLDRIVTNVATPNTSALSTFESVTAVTSISGGISAISNIFCISNSSGSSSVKPGVINAAGQVACPVNFTSPD